LCIVHCKKTKGQSLTGEVVPDRKESKNIPGLGWRKRRGTGGETGFMGYVSWTYPGFKWFLKTNGCGGAREGGAGLP